MSLPLEGLYPVTDLGPALVALVYIAVVNSVVGLLLLGVLVRRGGTGAAASLFFLMPPVTAVLEWLVLHRTLGPREVGGLVIAVLGVAVATRSPPERRRPPGHRGPCSRCTA